MSKKSYNRKNRMNDFLRYRQNKMSGVERNAFERELQKDPFAAEALEGLEKISPEEFRDDLKHLLKKHNARSKSKKTVLFFRIAASVIILLSISSLLYISTRTRESEISDQMAEVIVPFEIIENKPITKNTISEDLAVRSKQESINKAAGKSNKEGIRSPVESDKRSEAVIDTVSDKNFDQRIAELSRTNISTEQIDIEAPSASKPIELQVRSDDKKTMTKVSDNADSFNLKSAKLSEDRLEEVVVIGFGHKKAQQIVGIEKSDNKTAEPSYGYTRFKKYIEDNIIRPDTLQGQRIVVIASFVVTADGKIDSIRFERNPGRVFTSEAARLIEQSPPWIPAEENGIKINSEVRLRIVFR